MNLFSLPTGDIGPGARLNWLTPAFDLVFTGAPADLGMALFTLPNGQIDYTTRVNWLGTPFKFSIGAAVPIPLTLVVSKTRARLGDRVTVKIVMPEVPFAVPVLEISSISAQLTSFPIPFSGKPSTFEWTFRLPKTSFGTLTLNVTAKGPSGNYSGSSPIVLISGGDPAGRVISLSGNDSPSGCRVLAHLDDGSLVQGNSPRL